MNIKKIKELAKKKGVTLKELSKELGITYQTFTNSVNSNNMSGVVIEKAAKFFNVPVSIFFDEETSEVTMLKQRIKDLEEIIKLLKEKKH